GIPAIARIRAKAKRGRFIPGRRSYVAVEPLALAPRGAIDPFLRLVTETLVVPRRKARRDARGECLGVDRRVGDLAAAFGEGASERRVAKTQESRVVSVGPCATRSLERRRGDEVVHHPRLEEPGASERRVGAAHQLEEPFRLGEKVVTVPFERFRTT